MEPITLTLLALGGFLVLNSKSKKSISKYIPTVPVSLRGFELTCFRIEVTNIIQFEEYINKIVLESSKQKQFQVVSNSVEYLNFINYCYSIIIKDFSLKCTPISEQENAVTFLLKRKISGEYNQLILGYPNKQIYDKYMNDIVNPVMDKIISGLGLSKEYSEIAWSIFLNTGKYPNSNYKSPEDTGFIIECSIESAIQILDSEKFNQYLKNIVKELSEKWQFKDPYQIEFEKFIDEYLKMINNYCYWTLKNNTISDHGKKILYILIQYGLQNYINLKFSTDELVEQYKKAYFNSEWEHLQKVYSGISDSDIYELEDILVDQGSL